MLNWLRLSLGRQTRATLLAAGTLLGIDVASDITVNEIADVQTAQDVARHDQAPPARVERSISTSVKALTMALLLVLAPLSAAGSTREGDTDTSVRAGHSILQDQRYYFTEVVRSFEVSVQLQLPPEKVGELAYALDRYGNALAELIQRNLPSGLTQLVKVNHVRVSQSAYGAIYGTAHAEVRGAEAVHELRESIGKIIYDTGAELLREKCHAVEHAFLESKGEKGMLNVAQEIVEMQLFRRRSGA